MKDGGTKVTSADDSMSVGPSIPQRVVQFDWNGTAYSLEFGFAAAAQIEREYGLTVRALYDAIGSSPKGVRLILLSALEYHRRAAARAGAAARNDPFTLAEVDAILSGMPFSRASHLVLRALHLWVSGEEPPALSAGPDAAAAR